MVFARATELKREFRETRRHAGQPLAGRNVALIFEKQSLRTRVTFEAGLNQLGGHGLHLGEGIGFGVRESVADIAHNLERWIDGIVIRTFDHSVVTELAAKAGIPVFNALTDDEHPFQALADLLAMREHFGGLEGRVLTFVGDGNNVYHSLALAGATLGMEIRLAHPEGYGPHPTIVAPGGEAGRGERREDRGRARPEASWRPGRMRSTRTSGSRWARRSSPTPASRPSPATAWTRPCWSWPARRQSPCTVCQPIAARRSRPRSSTAREASPSSRPRNRLHVQKAFLVESLGR